MDDAQRTARLMVVEDDPAIRSGVTSSLRQAGYEVHTEADGSGVRKAVEEFRPDLAVLDVHLGEGPDGFTLARMLRASTDMPLLFLTAKDDLGSRLAGFDAGGDDYLVKPFSMAELHARILALLRRSGRLASGVWQLEDLVVDEDARTATRGGEPLDLTHIEYELLTVLIRNKGKVLSKVRLMSKVWGFEFFDVNLVEKHVGALRRKLENRGPRLLQTVRGSGYVLK